MAYRWGLGHHSVPHSTGQATPTQACPWVISMGPALASTHLFWSIKIVTGDQTTKKTDLTTEALLFVPSDNVFSLQLFSTGPEERAENSLLLSQLQPEHQKEIPTNGYEEKDQTQRI